MAMPAKMPAFAFRALSLVLIGLVGSPVGIAHGASRSALSQSPASPDTTRTVPRTVQRLLIKGTIQAQLGDPEEAISYFESALTRTPNEPALLQALADAHAAQDDLSTALFYARKARRQGPENAYYHRRLAELQHRAGERQAAVQTYKALLERFPDERAAYRGLATLQAEMGQPRAALATYDSLLTRGARSPTSIYQEMLPLYRRVGNTNGVERALRALVAHRPNNRHYRRLLGELYADAGRTNAALDLLAPLAEQQPDNDELQRLVQGLTTKTGAPTSESAPTPPGTEADRSTLPVSKLVRRAQAALDRAPTDPDPSALRSAEAALRDALDRAPRNVPALRLQARLSERRGAYARAGDLLKRAIDEHPKSPDLWARAATMYLNARDYDTAATVAEEGLLLFPGETALAQRAAFARLRGGAPARARDHFQNALELAQNDSVGPAQTATLQAGLALTYTLLNRPENADPVLEEALSAAPDSPAVLRTCAYSFALRGEQLDRALTLARSAAEQAPTDPLTHDVLGWVQFQHGDLEAARRALQHALDAGPPTARILEHFGDVQHALGNDSEARTYWRKALDRAPDRSSLRKKLNDTPTP